MSLSTIYDAVTGEYSQKVSDNEPIIEELILETPPAQEQQTVSFIRAMAMTATTLSDQEALSMPDILPTWQEFLDSGREIPSGVCLMHDGQCYRQAQSTPVKPEAHRPPGSPGMSAVYRPVASGHAGTLDDPIPWVYEMDCKEGKYYSHNGKIYLCTGNMSPCVWEPGGGAPQWEEVA